MLRCPPSQIHLTYEDIRGLEHRLTAKKEARQYQMAPNARLVPGPRREIRRSTVPAEKNVAAKRAASVESQGTLHAADGQLIEQWPITFVNSPSGEWAVALPSAAESPSTEQRQVRLESPGAYADATQPRLSPPVSSPRRRVDSMLCIDENGEDPEPLPPYESQSTSYALNLDGIGAGVMAHHGRDEPVNLGGTPPTHGRLESDINSQVVLTGGPPHSEPPPLSSARARRFRPRSHDERTSHQPPPVEPQNSHCIRSILPQTHHMPQIRSQPIDIPPSVPEAASLRQLVNPALDPGAPVFVPRIRFGSATTSVSEAAAAQRNTDGTWSSIDSSQTVSQIRTRRSSELNVEQNVESRQRVRTRRPTTGDNGAAAAGLGPRAYAAAHTSLVTTHRRTSVMSDENGLPTAPNPNLERYPVLRSPTSRAISRIPSGLLPPPTLATRHGPSRVTSNSFHFPRQVSGSVYGRSSGSFNLHNELEEDPTGRLNAPSPAFSASSMSTPNLLQPSEGRESRFHSRGSSLDWRNHYVADPTPAHRVPSIVSAASGISDKSSVVDYPHQVLNAQLHQHSTAEVLGTRRSPLDELTERLAGVSMHPRLRSVGRSFERLRDGKPIRTLLSGTLFAPSSSPEHSDWAPEQASYPKGPETSLLEETSFATALTQPEINTSVEVPSPSPHTAANSLHFSSPAELPSPSTFRPPAAVRANPPSSLPPSSLPPSAAAPPAIMETPRMRIYNDAEPATAQPQTPADIPTTARANNRHRQRSQSHTTQQQQTQNQHQEPPIFIGRSIMASPPTIPPRHAHRHTFPSSIVMPFAAATAPVSVAVTPVRRAEERSSDENAGEFEGHLLGLEGERRVWLGRRGQGGLEVTPPGEGRFERFLNEE